MSTHNLKIKDAGLRMSFYRANAITHAFSWKEDNKWTLYVGDAKCIGFNEGQFKTLKALRASLSDRFPELPFYKGNT